MKATLNDFGIKFKKVPLLCDNESAIKLTNNPVQHARKAHWCPPPFHKRSSIERRTFALRMWTPKTNLLTYSPSHLMRKRFCMIRNELNILDFSNMCWCTSHFYDMPLLRAIQGKSWLVWHTFFAKDMFSASSNSSCLIGSYMKIKWIWYLYGTTIAFMLDLI
jgi:hypothetical protein